jgi:hypothetical protein
VLRFLREMRENAGMIGQIVQAPGRGAAGRLAELDGDVEGDLMVVLVATPPPRLQRVNETGVDKFLDRFMRNVAVAFASLRARPIRSSALGL